MHKPTGSKNQNQNPSLEGKNLKTKNPDPGSSPAATRRSRYGGWRYRRCRAAFAGSACQRCSTASSHPPYPDSATALQVTLPQRCGSRYWYGRKVPFGPDTAHTTRALLDFDSMNEERCECGHRFGSPRGQVSLMDRMAHYDVCPLTLADKRAASSPAKPVRASEKPRTRPAVSDDRS